MSSVKELLKNSLKDLSEDDLKEFQWHLLNDREYLSKSEMENADRLKTVDKMVECFGPEEAVTITVEILKKINQNNLAEQLENNHKQDVVRVRPTKRRNSKESIPPEMSDLRIVLLGRSVSENSRVGNFILRRAVFDSESPPADVELYSERVRGRHVTVINTPLLLSSDLSLRHITQGVKECVSLSAPGPHVIALVLKPDECSREEKVCVEMVLNCFSDSVFEHTLVLTTQEPDGAEPTEVNDVIKKIINKCFNRHYRLGTNSTPADLTATLQEIVQGNNRRYLICNKYEDLYFATEATERAQAEGSFEDPAPVGASSIKALTSQTIEVAALGRPLSPGMLYDCRKDTFIPVVNLWEKTLREDLDSRPQPRTDLKFSSSDSLSSKSSLLDVSASLKASFLGGLVEVEGSAKFLHDTKSSNQQSRVTMNYRETTRFDQLTMTQLGQITYPQVFDQKTATHVITGVLYGAQAVIVFDQTFSEEEEKQEIEGGLNVMVKNIPQFSIEGQGALQMTDAQKKVAENITCTFYGDVRLDQNPTTYIEALEVYKKLPTILKENPQNAVPIKVCLYPLSLLDTKAAQLEREITTHLVSYTEYIIEELGEVERTCNDLSRKTLVNVFKDIKERLHSFQNTFSIYKPVLLKEVAKVLPAIRGGEMEQKSLEDILKIHYSSPFNAGMLNQWLDHAKAELNRLSTHTEKLKGINTVDSNRLNAILFNLDIDVVVCLTFTSLKYEDPDLSAMKKFLESDPFKVLDVGMKHTSSMLASVRKGFTDPDVSKMRKNLSLFRSFSEANKDEKRYRFIISAISDPSNPGSSIYLYESGNLTDTQFQPVSKPPPPEVMKVLEHSVILKLQKSPTGETVQFRVEYQQEKADSGTEEQWIIINTSDEVFTLTGLEFGKQYSIRYRIVGKVGVSEASDTIGPIQSLATVPKTRSEFLQYSRQLTLDLNTVYKYLHLSEENRVITITGGVQTYPDHQDRFDEVPQVLCRESVTGRSYWEMEWNGGYVSISVSYKSISRRGRGNGCKFGCNDQSWSLDCTPSSYSFWHKNVKADHPVESSSHRVGVYVDHSAGILSFYSVSGDTMIPIHTVQTTFTQPLYPGFWFSNGSVKLLMNENRL